MKLNAACLIAGLLALATVERAQADGTEGLGTPSIPIATGTGIAAGGVGLITQPGTLNVTVPIGATVKQVLLYWEGFMATDTAGDSTIRVSKGGPSTIVNGTLIGGPSFFFFTAYASTFRADITSLGLITPGANSLTLDGLNFTFADGNPLQFANHGAGIFVIYDDGGPATQINVRDGNDLAYWNFPDPRRDTIPQTFTFAPAPANRVSRLDMFFASVAGKTSTGTIERPNAIEITVGGVTTVYNNLMDSFSGEEWDHVSLPVNIPAGVTTVKVQAFSRDGVPLGLNPASFDWLAAFFAIQTTAHIGDLVFNDLNANGVQDGGGEVGVAGVTVELFTCPGNVLVGTTVTAGGGLYGFDVPPGDYYVKFRNLPAGFIFSPSTPGAASDPTDSDANPATGITACTTLLSGENDPTWDAGIYQPVGTAQIGDIVFNDKNANGSQNFGEDGVDGVKVELFTCGGNVLTGTAVTAGGGLYLFTVPPGQYYVKFSNLPPGFVFSPSTPSAASDPTDSDANPGTGLTDCTTLTGGEVDPTWDAGIYQPALIGDLVFNDTNANGTQDGGEVGVNGVKVELFTCIGNVLMGTTDTAGGGLYAFTVPPGDYYVKFSNLPGGFVFSPSTPSIVSDATDSDANPATGVADCTTLLAGEVDLTWDAGIYQPAKIGDLVFNDTNANGNQDGGELGVNGVTVELFTCVGDAPVGSTVTAGGGLYGFTVPPGVYYVKFSNLPAGFVFSPSTPGGALDPTDSDADPATGKTHCTALDAGETDITWDAGIYQPARIGDLVFNDTNANGNQNVGEVGVNGVKVELFTCISDVLMGTAVTAGGGLYSFTVPPGNYYVKFSNLPAGFVFSPSSPSSATDETDSDANPATGLTDCTTLLPGETDLSWDAGIYQPAKIGDLVFNDLNANGIQDGGSEVGIDGVSVELLTCFGDVLMGTAVTAGGGLYLFTVPPGNYYVKFSNLPAGFVFSPSTSSSASDANDSDANPATGMTDCTTLLPGETDPTWDAGIYQPPQAARIGDLVFNDLNANGIQDGGGEVGINGVTVELFTCAGDVLMGTTVTASGGLYLFTVPPGDYYVKFSNLPAGFVFSPSAPSGASDPADSDANSTTGVANCTTLVANETDITWDAGIYQLPCIGDLVFNDLNANGNQDGAGEVGVNGVTVQLYNCLNNALVTTTVTSGGGLYSFCVRPGSYYVRFSNLPAGFIFSPSTPGGASDPNDSDANPATGRTDCTDLTPGETDRTWDAGIYQPAKIGDLVFNDLNANGIQNGGGEVGVDGVTVELYTCVGDVLMGSTVTAGGGLYLFTVPPGNYYVKFSNLPAGFVFSPSTSNTASDPTDSDANPATGATDCTTLVAGETDPMWDAGIYQPAKIGDLVFNDLNANGNQDGGGEVGVDGVTVELYTCAGDVLVGTSVTAGGGMYMFTVAPGDYYVKFSNLPTGFLFSPSTPGGASDPTDSDANAATGKADCTTLTAGENDPTWDAGIYSRPPCVVSTFDFAGTSAASDAMGNIRTFSAGGVTVNVSAFSRLKASSTWSTAYLGSYPGGLGVTDSSEGDGSADRHLVDNIDRNNYVLFEFSAPVIVDRAFLGYVVTDSDLAVWIGTFPDPFNNHLTLNDSVLAAFGFTELNQASDGATRWANFNAGEISGNALVIAALPSGSNDRFKIQNLDICAPPVPPPATIGDFVWDDANKNGKQDAGEPGVNGVKVELFRCAGDLLVATTTTSVGGLYRFTVAPGDYYVKFSNLPAGYVFSPKNAASTTAANDSDVNPATGKADCTTLVAGENDTTWDAGIYNHQPPCVLSTFNFTGSSASSGTAGNIRTYSAGGVTVKVSAFSRLKAAPTWSTAFLGAYAGGLGVTDASEGDGSANRHLVDNSDRNNYVLFEFSAPVVVDRAFLGYVVTDSDLKAWIGTFPDPFNNHLTLSDSVLAAFAFSESSSASSGATRWADLNAGSVVGNVLVIAANPDGSNDQFKIEKLDACVPPTPSPATIGNFVWNDTNKNGRQDAGELGVNGVKVELFTCVDNVVRATTTTSGGGLYSFTVAPGDYYVKFSNQPAGYVFSPKNAAGTTTANDSDVNPATGKADCTTLVAGENDTTWDAGIYGLPSPWQTADIGAVAAAGSAGYSGTTFTVAGSGADIGGSADEFRYVYQQANGNCTIVAKVLSVANIDAGSGAGVMIRETLTTGSRHATLLVTPSSGLRFKTRTTTSGSTSTMQTSGSAPYWVRMVRSGNIFTASRSTDGTTWTSMGSVTITMGSTVYIGLAVNSRKDGTLCTGTFNNVTATP